jgi:hypothetical protein
MRMISPTLPLGKDAAASASPADTDVSDQWAVLSFTRFVLAMIVVSSHCCDFWAIPASIARSTT